jgi:hypothetical protein
MAVVAESAAVLCEIEAIKQLKARYCRHLDAKDWVSWRACADGFVSELAPMGGEDRSGADCFVAHTRRTLGRPSQVSVHQVHAPEISSTSATTACGVWAMTDLVRLFPAVMLHGYGHYHETYEKLDGRWQSGPLPPSWPAGPRHANDRWRGIRENRADRRLR